MRDRMRHATPFIVAVAMHLACGGPSPDGDGPVATSGASSEDSDTMVSDADSGDGGSASDADSHEQDDDEFVRHRRLSSQGYRNCAIAETGGVYCWGYGRLGELGSPGHHAVGDDERPFEVGPVELGGPALSVQSSSMGTCALLESGDVRCWGANHFGALGSGRGGPGVCKLDGDLAACGDGATCCVGDDERPIDVEPVELGAPALELLGADGQMCVRLEGGIVRCWGFGSSFGWFEGQAVGDDETPLEVDPVPLRGPAVRLLGGPSAVCAQLEDGDIYCWGRGSLGPLSEANSGRPVRLELGFVPTALAVDTGHGCAIDDEGRVKCWGRAGLHGLGRPELDPASCHADNCFGPTECCQGDDEAIEDIPFSSLPGRVLEIAVGYGFSCARLEDGAVRCWGRNGAGQIGLPGIDVLGDDEAIDGVEAIELAGPAASLSVGELRACAHVGPDRVQCWGSNFQGALGLGLGEDECPSPACGDHRWCCVGDDEAPVAVSPIELR